MDKAGVVNIHGKEYKTVALRISEFREKYPDYTIRTKLVADRGETVVMKASILNGPELLATGYAEESRTSSHINQTSAVENCETSAVGRALAFLGLAGTEIASADEVANAITQQREKQIWADNRAFMDAFEKHYSSIVAIREFLAVDNFDAAREAMQEIPNEDKMALNRAWTKGGPFNPRETKQIKWWSNDFENTRKANA